MGKEAGQSREPGPIDPGSFETLEAPPKRTLLIGALAFLACGAIVYVSSRHSHALVHNVVEVFCVAVASAVFFICWNARRFIDKGGVLLLGIAYLPVAAFELLHMLAYREMGAFAWADVDLPFQLWICARSIEAGSLCLVPFLLERRLRPGPVLLGYLALSLVLTAGVFGGLSPRCLADSEGLTGFAKAVEFAIVGLLGIAGVALFRRRGALEPTSISLLLAVVAFSAGAELSFLLQGSFSGFANVLGHYLKLVSFFLLYQLFVVKGIRRPFALLFHGLQQSRAALAEENSRLVAAQRELDEKNVALEQLNARMNEFLGIVAHDIRSPLSVVKMYAMVLIRQLEEEKQADALQHLQTIKRNADLSLELVADLLDIAAIESGKLTLRPCSTDLVSLVGRTVEVNRLLAERKAIGIQYEPDPGLPRLTVDPLRIVELLNNLLNNAVSYSPEETTIAVKLQQKNGAAILSVKDQGQGIPADEQRLLFQPFGTTSVKGTAGEKSTGLGLAIVRKIANAHRGKVWVESRPGAGSTFYVSLPLQD